MQKTFSPKWISSKQPRKQRKYRFNAPMHIRHKFVSAHLDKALRKEYGRRSMPVRSGDEVIVTRGEFRKKSGKVAIVDMKAVKVYIEGIAKKKVSGQEHQIAFDPSNLMITKMKVEDKGRLKVLKKHRHHAKEKKKE